MKRGIFGLALLAVFLFTGLWSAGAMKRFHMPLSDRLEQAAQDVRYFHSLLDRMSGKA